MQILPLAKRLIQFQSSADSRIELNACLDFCADYFPDASFCKRFFESEGWRSLLVSTSNTLLFDILLCGHVDAVAGSPELFEAQERDGRLYGRASLDMKAFVATSMKVLETIVREGLNKTVGLLIVTDEENGGYHGTRYVVDEIGLRTKVALVPDDGESLSKIVSETKSLIHVKFEAKGKESHACRPWEGTNAIRLLMKTCDNLYRHFPGIHSAPDETWINTINVGTIEGGVAVNEVPDHASMGVDIRFVAPTSREDVIGLINSSCIEGVSYKIAIETEPLALDRDNSLLRQYCDAVERVTKAQPSFSRSGGNTDARYFARRGMLAIVHQGAGGGCQGEDEYVVISDLEKLVQIQCDFVRTVSF
jgi:succinyl-diaminopimelate desuccinylase